MQTNDTCDKFFDMLIDVVPFEVVCIEDFNNDGTIKDEIYDVTAITISTNKISIYTKIIKFNDAHTTNKNTLSVVKSFLEKNDLKIENYWILGFYPIKYFMTLAEFRNKRIEEIFAT